MDDGSFPEPSEQDIDDLFSELADLKVKYREAFSVPHFGAMVTVFIAIMLFDTSKSEYTAYQLFSGAIEKGHAMSKKRRVADKEESE
jgi:hypothetical protein